MFLYSSAFAQDIPAAAVDAQLYRAPLESAGTLWTEEAGTTPGPLARVGIGYVHDPFVWVWQDTGEKVPIVGDALGVDLAGSYGFGPVRAGVDVPFYPVASGSQASSGGLGDLTLLAKASALDGRKAPVGLALLARVTVPTATTNVPLGSDGVTWELAVAADKHVGPVLLALNVGERGVPPADLANIDLANLLTWRAGGGYAIGDRAGVSLDVAGQVAWGGADAAGTPVEALVGGWWKAADLLTLRLGVGRGLTSGIGASGGRALLAAEWRPVPSKRPAANPPAANPPAANPSGSSRRTSPTGGASAPTAAAPAGTDARVIPGPTSPGDGPKVLPPTATVAVAPPATVAVAPPDARPAHVTITREKLLLPANVEFDGARIEPASYPVLDEVVAVLRAHPEITGVRIEGHTDDAGSPDDDLTLSGARAAAVQDYFVQRGLDPGRFLVAGYGSSRPLDRSGTDAARARNRRIELVITDWREGTAPP